MTKYERIFDAFSDTFDITPINSEIDDFEIRLNEAGLAIVEQKEWNRIDKLPDRIHVINDLTAISGRVIGWKSGSDPVSGWFEEILKDFLEHKKGEIRFIGENNLPIDNISHWMELPLNPVVLKQF